MLFVCKVPAIHTVCIDLSDVESAMKTIESLGNIQLLVNNAAIAKLAPFKDVQLEDFDKYVYLALSS